MIDAMRGTCRNRLALRSNQRKATQAVEPRAGGGSRPAARPARHHDRRGAAEGRARAVPADRGGSGVSEATVRARYGRLCDDGILQVTAVTNPLGLGFEAQALIGISTSGSPEVLADEIAQWDEADYVVITAGRFDLLVEVLCVDRRHLLDLTNRIRALDGVHSTESFLYLELWKQLYDWGARTTRSTATERSS